MTTVKLLDPNGNELISKRDTSRSLFFTVMDLAKKLGFSATYAESNNCKTTMLCEHYFQTIGKYTLSKYKLGSDGVYREDILSRLEVTAIELSDYRERN